MKKTAIFIVLLTFAVSCKTSKKGAWLESDKKAFMEGCMDEIKRVKDTQDGKTLSSVVNLDEFGKKSCECALKKYEEFYENPTQAQKDETGLTKIAEKCGEDVMTELMKLKK